MKLGGHQRSQSWILLALLALGNLGGPHWEFITILLFKGPAVWGALCALSRHGFRGFVWEFCFESRPFNFNAASLTLSVDSTIFSFCLYVWIRSLYFLFCLSCRFVLYCYSFPRSN